MYHPVTDIPISSQLTIPNMYSPMTDIPDVPPRNVVRKRHVAAVAMVCLLFSGGFLMWDHVRYKDESPPVHIAVIRDICAIFLFLSLILLSVVASIIWAKKWARAQPTNSTAADLWVMRMFFVALVLYAAAGFHWAGTYGYYTLGHHAIPDVANVFRWISMVYFIVVSVIIILAVMSHLPPEVICFCFLLSG